MLLLLEVFDLNPEVACIGLNRDDFAKTLMHLFATFILLVTGHKYLFAFNLPLLILALKDVTLMFKFQASDIMDLDKLRKHVNLYILYLYFFILSFFIYAYW